MLCSLRTCPILYCGGLNRSVGPCYAVSEHVLHFTVGASTGALDQAMQSQNSYYCN